MDVVLVHGTTQSPEGWEPLGEELTRRGHCPYLIDLALPIPSHGDGAADLDCYLDTVAGQVPGSVREPVVVAHSGSGAVLADLAQRLGASRQVWLAAWVPDAVTRQPMLDEMREDGSVMMNPEWRERNTGALDDADATYFLFHDCDYRSLRRALSTVRIWSPLAVYQARPQADPTVVPSTYVVPTLDRTLRAEWMATAARQRLNIEPIRMGAGHCPHISKPQELVTIIESAEATTA